MYPVPYAFDMMVKPYIKLTSNDDTTRKEEEV
jgi:hypothetical protein